MSTEELLVRSMAALDERIAKARAGGLKIGVKADRQFVVANGEGGVYAADFSKTNTGVCNCPDFVSHGRYLHACKHTAAIVLDQWPDAFERWEAKVRALVRAGIAQLPADSEPELPSAVKGQPPAGISPATRATEPTTAHTQLVAAAVQATLPLVLAQILAAVEEAAPEITRQVLADMADTVLSSAAQEASQQ